MRKDLLLLLPAALVAQVCGGGCHESLPAEPRFQCSGPGDDTCGPGYECARAPDGREYAWWCMPVGSVADAWKAADSLDVADVADAVDIAVTDHPAEATDIRDTAVPDGLADALTDEARDAPGDEAGDPSAEGCVAQCAGKECGPDGCGGECGTCAGGEQCVSGTCKCVENDHKACCGDAVCWYDSCGVVGEQTADCPYGCTEGKCLDCTPDCTGKECGDDGCGGECGTCAPGSCVGLAWTKPKTCVAGACTGGGTESCEDLNECTDDTCDATWGCGHENNAVECAPARCEGGKHYAAAYCSGGTCPAQTGVACADGLACTVDTCDAVAGCSNPLSAGWCLIEGVCYADGQANPGNACQVCASATQPGAWSAVAAGTSCGTNAVCVAGLCESTCCTAVECPPGYQAWDGCHCKVVPTAVTQCHTDAGLVDCTDIAQDQEWYGQDGHYDTEALSFTDQGDGTVKDNRTGLVWSKATSSKIWTDAKSYCSQNALGLPGSGWRLPEVYELMAIVDYSKGSCPMWHPAFGTSCPPWQWFWSSTPVPWSSSNAFAVYFGDGYVSGSDVGDGYGVRCVRAGS